MAERPSKKRASILVGIAIVVFLAIGLPALRGFSAKYERSQAQLEQTRNRVIMARDLRETILIEREGNRALAEQIRKRGGRFDLYSFVNTVLRENNLQGKGILQSKRLFSGGNIDGVQLSLQGVNMKELVDLVHALYASQNLIALQRLNHLRPARNGRGMDCEMVFMAPTQ